MTRHTTDDYRRLDVRALHRAGMLTTRHAAMWNWSSRGVLRASIHVRAQEDHVFLTYTATENGERREYSYPVRLDWTPCQYGGARPWFLCPARGCGRRVAILYGGAVFACRHCYRLAYESQRERDYNRLAGRADKIRQRLGWPVGILNATPRTKPKAMHWRTFWRLTAEHDALVGAALAGMSEHLGITERRLEAQARFVSSKT
ncbi:MAG: hypothetical protein JSR83_11195 [Proteobacteria bacterium]|nr:hypothetical protein [Pseudomonadota bacterium]